MSPTTAPHRLIFASKVKETAVFNTARERIGHIEDVAIGKLDGKVAYAILSFGDFLGIGEKYHPLPWSILTYDTALNGYTITLTKEALEKAPSYSTEELADIGDTDERYRQGIYDYYGPFGATLERENENFRVPAQAGEPPRSATEPPGSEWSVRTDKTVTDPDSGEPHEARRQRLRSRKVEADVKPASGSPRG